MKKEKPQKNKPEEVAIKVEGVSKTFNVPHEKNTSIKGAALNMFRRKNYEKFEALKEVSFEVKKGEFFGIIGRNGSGKSTLLKILAGIYVPDSGKITINGKLSPFLELGVGFNPELTGRENLFLGGAILGLTRREVEEKYELIVKFAELEEFIDMKLKNYSSGMQVRLAFSLAINAHAEILLMDEVLAVGDNSFQAKCIQEFIRYKEEGKTVVLVSHDLDSIGRYCDKAVLLENGVITSSGNPRDVISQYKRSSLLGDEEKKHNHVRKKGNHILDVKVKNGDGLVKKSFEDKDKIEIAIKYRIVNPVEPVVGVAIYNDKGVEIAGPNTETSDIILDSEEGDYEVKMLIENCFFTGKYFVTVGLFDKKTLKPFDFINKIADFNVFSNEVNQNGIIKVKTKWMI